MPVIGLIGPLELCSLVTEKLIDAYGFIACHYTPNESSDSTVQSTKKEKGSSLLKFTGFEEAESFWLKRPSAEYYVTTVERNDSIALEAFSKRTLFLIINVQHITNDFDPILYKHAAFSVIFDVDSEEISSRLDILLKSLALNTGIWYRPDWDTYFMEMARLAASRSNCCKRRVGCILVSSGSVIATGYNGTPRNMRNCIDGGCARCAGPSRCGIDLAACLCLHAEENALLEAGRFRTLGSTLYCTTAPCLQCAKKIVQCGVKRVVYAQDYAVEHDCKSVLAEAGITLDKYLFRDNFYLLSTQMEAKLISRTSVDAMLEDSNLLPQLCNIVIKDNNLPLHK